MTEALIIDACRTPRGIGKVGKGALADMHPQHLGATVLKALAERNNLNTAEVDDILWGTSTQKGTQGSDLGRMSALDAGYDQRSSGITMDRFCGISASRPVSRSFHRRSTAVWRSCRRSRRSSAIPRARRRTG